MNYPGGVGLGGGDGMNPMYLYYGNMPARTWVHNYQISMAPNHYVVGMPALSSGKLPKHLSFESLALRLETYEYIYNGMYGIKDGQNACFNDCKNGNNLLQYIMYIDGAKPINDYYPGISEYTGLSRHMRVYKGCYPISYNASYNVTRCDSSSVGLQIRRYDMVENDKKGKDKFKQLNLWKELIYYRIVRDDFFRKRKCPNFINIYSFYFCPDDIDKFKTDYMRNNKGKYTALEELEIKEEDMDKILKNNKVNSDDMKKNDNKTMLILTEAPTYSLEEWCSYKYSPDGVHNRRETHIGLKPTRLWKNTIFQILFSLHCIFENGKFMYCLGDEDVKINISELLNIKNFKQGGYWIYEIDNIKYYVPNFGFIFLFNLSFKNYYPIDSLKRIYIVENIKTNDEKQKFCNDNVFETFITRIFDYLKKKNIKSTETTAFITLLETEFKKEYKNSYRTELEFDDDVDYYFKKYDLIVKKLLKKYFKFYMNNYIGERCKIDDAKFILEHQSSLEVTNVSDKDEGKFFVRKKGNEFQYCIIDKVKSSGSIDVIVSRDENIDTETVNVSDLFKYLNKEPIKTYGGEDYPKYCDLSQEPIEIYN